MVKLGRALLLTAIFGIAAGNVQAQQRDQTSVIDSIAVRGADRSGRAAVISRINIALGQPVGFLDVQRALEALYATGQYADIKVLQATLDGKEVLLFEVVERAILGRWDVEGTSKVPERSVRGKVRLLAGRPFNPADVSVAVSAIDSLYKKEGYYQTRIESRVLPQDDGRVNVVFIVKEGSRVAANVCLRSTRHTATSTSRYFVIHWSLVKGPARGRSLSRSTKANNTVSARSR